MAMSPDPTRGAGPVPPVPAPMPAPPPGPPKADERLAARHRAAAASVAWRARRRTRLALGALAVLALLAGRELMLLREAAAWDARIAAVNAAPGQALDVVREALALGAGAPASAPAPQAESPVDPRSVPATPTTAPTASAAASAPARPAWLDRDHPAAWRHAEALALAAAGEGEAALARYRSLAEDPRLGVAARYNSGNLLMRQALVIRESTTPGLAVPLLELAKESYRQVLRLDPQHWDARYNLERAQRLLPDPEPSGDDEGGPPEDAERAATTMRGVSQGLP